MAGMGDNPLVGEYTKGISKGHSYFVALDRRIKREKADPKHVVSDLEMGLIRDQKAFLARSIALSGLGDFGPKTAFSSVAPRKKSGPKVVKKITQKDGMGAMVLLLQKHFCG